MAYIGNIPADKYQTLQKQSFSTSATDTYTLSYAVTNPQDLALFINNVRQNPNDAYTVSGTTLTLSSAITGSDTMYAVFLGRAVETVAPALSSVTNDMLAGSISNAKLANSSITLNGSAVSLGGSATVGGSNTPAFQANSNTQAGVSDNTATKVDFSNELFDTDGCYDTSNKRFTPTTAGKYYIYSYVNFNAVGVDKFHSIHLEIYKNGSAYKTVYFDEYDNYYAYAKTPFIGAMIDFNGSSDYVEIYGTFNVTSGTTHRFTGGSESSFGGYRIIGA